MLSSFENGIIATIKSALIGSELNLDESFNLDEAYAFSVKHQIVPIICYGLSNDKRVQSAPQMTKFFISTAGFTSFSATQLEELDKIFSAFDENGIEHLKLKGTILKKLYKYPEMRMMSDADIFVRLDKREAIDKIMTELGYTFECESDHELIWKKGKLAIELHKRLIPSYNQDLYAYYGEDPWEKLTRASEARFEYKMSDEDTFIYLFTHFAKHYRDGGIGVKFLTDFYVYLQAFPSLNLIYIEEELNKMGLLSFYKNTMKTLDAWFFDKEGDELTDFITSKIFSSNAYGEKKAKLEAEALRLAGKNKDIKKARRRKKRELLFPPYKNMCILFPILKKCKILLPFCWIGRLVRGAFTKRKEAKQAFEGANNMLSLDVERYDAELDYVGLSYWKK